MPSVPDCHAEAVLFFPSPGLKRTGREREMHVKRDLRRPSSGENWQTRIERSTPFHSTNRIVPDKTAKSAFHQAEMH
jgi:hypothetical protein